MSFHLIESSVLKVTKVKFSSLIWKIRHFKGQFLVSVSPIAKPFPQFTHVSLKLVSQKQSKGTLLNKTESYNHQFNCLLTSNIINRVGHCLHANSTNKMHKNAKTYQTLQQPHASGIKPGYPECMPDDSPVSLQQHDTQPDATPLNLRETLSFERLG